MESTLDLFIENTHALHNDSLTIEDDIKNDPDWKSTPLYNRIQKLQVKMIIVINYNCCCKYDCSNSFCYWLRFKLLWSYFQNKSKLSVQRLTYKVEPEEIKCACKTKCATRLCTCRKKNMICNNCNCNPELCQNRDQENVSCRTHFI